MVVTAILGLGGCGESYYAPRPGPGNGYTTSASVSTSSLSFGATLLGSTSGAQSVTLRNTGTGTLSFGGVSVSGINASSFLSSSNCGTSLRPGSSCAISVAFVPTASGTLTATLAISDKAVNGSQLVALSGTGTATGPVVSLSANALTFATLPVGQAATQTVTLSNIGVSALALNGFTLTGSNATSFALSGSCLTQGQVNAGGSCFLTVTYAPTVSAGVSAQVNVNDNAPGSPQTITLTSK
jgi:hypothetical protein